MISYILYYFILVLLYYFILPGLPMRTIMSNYHIITYICFCLFTRVCTLIINLFNTFTLNLLMLLGWFNADMLTTCVPVRTGPKRTWSSSVTMWCRHLYSTVYPVFVFLHRAKKTDPWSKILGNFQSCSDFWGAFMRNLPVGNSFRNIYLDTTWMQNKCPTLYYNMNAIEFLIYRPC